MSELYHLFFSFSGTFLVIIYNVGADKIALAHRLCYSTSGIALWRALSTRPLNM